MGRRCGGFQRSSYEIYEGRSRAALPGGYAIPTLIQGGGLTMDHNVYGVSATGDEGGPGAPAGDANPLFAQSGAHGVCGVNHHGSVGSFAGEGGTGNKGDTGLKGARGGKAVNITYDIPAGASGTGHSWRTADEAVREAREGRDRRVATVPSAAQAATALTAHASRVEQAAAATRRTAGSAGGGAKAVTAGRAARAATPVRLTSLTSLCPTGPRQLLPVLTEGPVALKAVPAPPAGRGRERQAGWAAEELPTLAARPRLRGTVATASRSEVSVSGRTDGPAMKVKRAHR